MIQTYKRFNIKMDNFFYILRHNSWFARIIAVLGMTVTFVMFELFLIFFPYLMYALDQFRLNSLDKWYLVAILEAPVIILLGAITLIAIMTMDCLKVFVRGSFYQPFTPIKGKIEIKRE